MSTQIKPKISLIFIMSCLLLFTHHAFALGKVGHKVVCQIAYDHLTPKTQHKIVNLLKEMPKEHKKLINKYNYKSSNATISFADTCTWADAIKKDKSFNKYKKWHYINVARNQTKVTQETCKKNCITNAINLHKKQLTELPISWKKLQALMFLGHWLGDIHQPMHVNFASDLGGNRTKITMNNTKCDNMHWLWDECLLYSASASKKPNTLFTTLYNDLTAQWNKSPITAWQKDSVYTWATESLMITRSPDVLYCSLDKQNYCMPLKNKVTRLPSSYQNNNKLILENRMLKASARLAITLEQLL